MSGSAGSQKTTFREVLTAEVDAVFTKRKEFARAAGVSDGRVTQVLSGEKDVSPVTLDWVLRALPTVGARERVHAAWVREFAPLPLDPIAPDAALAASHELEARGEAKRALEVVVAALSAYPTGGRGPFHIRAADLEMRLGRYGQAARRLVDARKEARRYGEPFDELTARWLLSVLLATEGAPLPLFLKHIEGAASFGDSRGGGGPEWTARRLEVMRDEAVGLLKAAERGEEPAGTLERAAELAGRVVERAPTDDMKAVSLEVRARCELALGQLARAEDTIEAAEEVAEGGLDMPIKAGLLRAEILFDRKKRDEAADEFARISELARRAGSIHYFEAAEHRLARIVLGLVEPRARDGSPPAP